MEITILVAKLLGICFIASGIFIIIHKKTFAFLIKDLFENRALMFLTGTLLLIGGAAIVFGMSTTTGPLSFFIKILAWAMLTKGALYIFVPEMLRSVVKIIPDLMFFPIGVIVASIGVYFTFFLR